MVGEDGVREGGLKEKLKVLQAVTWTGRGEEVFNASGRSIDFTAQRVQTEEVGPAWGAGP